MPDSFATGGIINILKGSNPSKVAKQRKCKYCGSVYRLNGVYQCMGCGKILCSHVVTRSSEHGLSHMVDNYSRKLCGPCILIKVNSHSIIKIRNE